MGGTCPGLPQKIFQPFGPQFGPKIRGWGGALDPPLKRISVQLTTTTELAFCFGSHLKLINKNETRTRRCGGSFFVIKEHTLGFYWIAEVFHVPDFLF